MLFSWIQIRKRERKESEYEKKKSVCVQECVADVACEMKLYMLLASPIKNEKKNVSAFKYERKERIANR